MTYHTDPAFAPLDPPTPELVEGVPTADPATCPHDGSISREPEDPSVGIFGEAIWCDECGADLSNDETFWRDAEGDYADMMEDFDE